MGFTLQRLYDSAVSALQAQHLREVNLLARNIDNELLVLAGIAKGTADQIGVQAAPDAGSLYALLRVNIGRNPLIYGAAIAFEPFAFRPDLRLFSPYVYDVDRKAIDISASAYDYTEPRWEWYAGVRNQTDGRWSAPYFDTGAGNSVLTTYSAPIWRTGVFLGVTTIDLRLDQLSEHISDVLDNQKFLLVSRNGRFVAHYQPHLALNGSLQDFAATQVNPAYAEVQERILNGQSGLGIVSDLVLDEGLVPGNTWLFHTPVPSTGWFLVTLQPESELTRPLREQINVTLLGLALTILLIFVLVWLISSRLTNPIKKLEAAVSDVARGRLDTHIENIRSLDELGRLSIGFNRMLKNLKKQIDIQSQQDAQQKVLAREWEMARETQRSLLPTEFPPFPDHKEFELHAVNVAANHVAGDFFDFFLINPQTLVFVIADVSGKGMSAALVMAVTRTIVRDLAQSGRTPGDILRETNERLRESQKGAAFVTLFLGSYNFHSGHIIYANGGHLPPFLISHGGGVSVVGEATGTIVGMLEQQEYLDAELQLEPGDTLLLFTDGYPEARARSGEFFGTERITRFLRENATCSAKDLCEAALLEVSSFQNEQLADDLTLLALKRSRPA